jgi:hypothetical protein
LEDYSFNNERWHDGAVVANNPAAVAIEEARALWPDRPIECIVSVGSGAVGVKPRPQVQTLNPKPGVFRGCEAKLICVTRSVFRSKKAV